MYLKRAAYEPYRLSRREGLSAAALGALLGAGTGALFFGGARGVTLALPLTYAGLVFARKQKLQKQKEKLRGELKDYILTVVSLLRSGFSLENAMKRAEKETVSVHGARSMMAQEAAVFSRGLALQESAESLWENFGRRCGLKEALSLSRVLATAKQEGGDFLPLLKGITDAMEARRMTREEMRALIASARMELLIMCLMPDFLLLYLRIGAPELMQTADTQPAGRIFMLLACLIYGGSVALGLWMLENNDVDA